LAIPDGQGDEALVVLSERTGLGDEGRVRASHAAVGGNRPRRLEMTLEVVGVAGNGPLHPLQAANGRALAGQPCEHRGPRTEPPLLVRRVEEGERPPAHGQHRSQGAGLPVAHDADGRVGSLVDLVEHQAAECGRQSEHLRRPTIDARPVCASDQTGCPARRRRDPFLDRSPGHGREGDRRRDEQDGDRRQHADASGRGAEHGGVDEEAAAEQPHLRRPQARDHRAVLERSEHVPAGFSRHRRSRSPR
jgi:hypothetical protein